MGLLVLAVVFGWQFFNQAEDKKPAENDPANKSAANNNATNSNAAQQPGNGKFLKVISARVTRIADGDSFTCISDGQEIRVRMFGIDSPEREQPGYDDARDALRQAIDGKTVELRVVDVDQYDRQVARVILPAAGEREEVDVNRQQIAQGRAWWYRTYAPEEADLAEAEESAKAASRGIWEEANPLPPWEFRRRQRESGR